MGWLVLIGSGCLEAVWVIALDHAQGFTQAGFSLLFIVSLFASMAGLAFAVKTIPISTAYPIWVGSGAAWTVIWWMATGVESVNITKILLIIGILACVTGLKAISS